MKKSIYPPCLILLVLLLVPVTACTTKTAAEKPQESPARQEQSVIDASSRVVPAKPVAAETAKQPDAEQMQKLHDINERQMNKLWESVP